MEGYELNDYMAPNSKYLWYAKNEVDVLNEKSFKDLVYISHGWKNQVVDGKAVGPQEASSDGWFTQKQRYDAWAKTYPADETAEQRAQREVREDAEKYKNWETMHTNVMWYDTAACINTAHRISNINYLYMGTE